jgi:polygalacturonase
MPRQAWMIGSSIVAAIALAPTAAQANGPSVFDQAPGDAQAVTVRAVGDGKADDTAAIQQALDQAGRAAKAWCSCPAGAIASAARCSSGPACA